MKKSLLSITMLIILCGTAFGQTDHGYNIYGQLLGTSTGFGIGFDSRFKKQSVLGYSVGFSYIGMSFEDGPMGTTPRTSVDSRGISIPCEVNAIMGNRASKFEVGIGFTGYLIKRDKSYSYSEIKYIDGSDDIESNEYYSHKIGFRPNIIGTLSIGYRLQRKSGFFMKFGMSFLIGDFKCSPIEGLIPLPNICLGYTLPHF